MFKKINQHMFLLGTSVLLLTACSSKSSVGEMMMKSAKTVEKNSDQKKELAQMWEEGAELIEKGKDQVSDGKEQVAEGEDLIEDGEDNIAKGENMMSESEKIFKKKFPDSPLSE
jgi:hypothetical protein